MLRCARTCSKRAASRYLRARETRELARGNRLQFLPPRDQRLDLRCQCGEPALCFNHRASIAKEGRVGERGEHRLALPLARVDLLRKSVELRALLERELPLPLLRWRRRWRDALHRRRRRRRDDRTLTHPIRVAARILADPSTALEHERAR